ncbi:MAG: site-2 protease family protein [Ignavibacteriales bacterium]|nr:site-2 protease family protein [Ignavibacteriales bacterium]
MEHLYVLPVLLFSVVVHEVAHGWMAFLLGDPTARDMGRLTLNPIPHIDPVGSVIVPLVSFFSAGSVFIAWAKPVPVNPMNFSRARRNDIFVSAVGPLSNLLLALVCAVGFVAAEKIFGREAVEEGAVGYIGSFLVHMFAAGVTLNIFLAIFNLIPIPPLDGSHILSSLLPRDIGERYRQVGFAGIFILLVLMRIDVVRHAIVAVVITVKAPYVWLISFLS